MVAALTLTTWGTIGNLEGGEDDQDNLGVMASALAVSRHVSSLAATGNIASNAGMTRESVVASRNSIASYKSGLNSELDALEGKGYDDYASVIKEHVGLLISNVDKIEEGRPNILRALQAGEQNRQQLSVSTTRGLIPALSRSLDDQFYYIATGRGYEGAGDGGESLTQEEFMRYSHMFIVMNAVSGAHSFLSVVSRMVDPTLVMNVEEAFESAVQLIEKSIEYLSVNGGPHLDPMVIPQTLELVEAGSGEENFFDALRARLAMAVRERELIAANDLVLDRLDAEIDALVAAVEGDFVASKEDSESMAASGRMTAGIIGAVGVAAALVVAGLVVVGARREG